MTRDGRVSLVLTQGEPVPLFDPDGAYPLDPPEHPPPLGLEDPARSSDSVRGESSSSPGSGSSAPPADVSGSTEPFAPDVLAELPDDMQFSELDVEVYGQYGPVRRDSMRVPDIHLTTRIGSTVQTNRR